METLSIEEIAVNLLFFCVLVLLALMLLPHHSLVFTLRHCDVCVDWGGAFAEISHAFLAWIAALVRAFRTVGALIADVAGVW